MIEWIVGSLGLILLIGIIAVLVHAGFSHEDSPPQIIAKVVAIEPQSTAGYVVSIQVHNFGGQAAKNAWITGELVDQQGTVFETSKVQISFLPQGSFQNAALIFNRNPQDLQLVLRAIGFELQ